MGDLKQVAALAMNAGIDMDMVGEGFLTTLKKSVQEGKVTTAQIDAACRRILEAKFKLGLFEDPYRYCNEQRAASEIFTDANRKEARAIAAQSFVLLKNEPLLSAGTGLLPLKKSGNIALIGPLANNKENMPGTWSVAANFSKATAVLDGFKAVAGDAKILYAQGSFLDDDSLFEQRAGMFGKSFDRDGRTKQQLLDEALSIAAQADVIVAAVGESAEMSGECSSRSSSS